MVNPDRLTIEAVEAALRQFTGLAEVHTWHGRCYEIAYAIAESCKLIEGRPVYGSYTGSIHPKGWWAKRRHLDFVRHGWILLPDGRILDPTRWSFENKKPYIWLGGPDDAGFADYDACNDRYRQALYANRPCPAEYDHKKFFELPLSFGARLFLFKYSGEVLPRPLKEENLAINLLQLMWVANAPIADLAGYAVEIYRAIVNAGQRAMIPLDNREMILGQEVR